MARLQENPEAWGLRGRGSAPPPSPSMDEWLTADDAARYLGMTKKALYTAVERGQVPASRLARRLRFNRAGLAHLLLRGRVRGAGMASRVPSLGKDS